MYLYILVGELLTCDLNSLSAIDNPVVCDYLSQGDKPKVLLGFGSAITSFQQPGTHLGAYGGRARAFPGTVYK